MHSFIFAGHTSRFYNPQTILAHKHISSSLRTYVCKSVRLLSDRMNYLMFVFVLSRKNRILNTLMYICIQRTLMKAARRQLYTHTLSTSPSVLLGEAHQCVSQSFRQRRMWEAAVETDIARHVLLEIIQNFYCCFLYFCSWKKILGWPTTVALTSKNELRNLKKKVKTILRGQRRRHDVEYKCNSSWQLQLCSVHFVSQSEIQYFMICMQEAYPTKDYVHMNTCYILV